jgi:transposase
MKQFTPEQKHSILLEYVPLSTTHSFAALAARHAVAGGAEVVRRWHKQWDGSTRSLQHGKGAGRPRALSSRQVQQYVRGPLLRANRAHTSVHYPSVAAAVRQRTGASVSDRTVRRYGEEELGAKQGRGKKRTADESE